MHVNKIGISGRRTFVEILVKGKLRHQNTRYESEKRPCFSVSSLQASMASAFCSSHSAFNLEETSFSKAFSIVADRLILRRLASASNSLFKLRLVAFLGACVLNVVLMKLLRAYFKCALIIVVKMAYNKRLKRDCQRVAFPVPMSRGGFGCCV
ncbi:Death on curing protein, Doc toxin [Vibrio cholerae]|nr:Death on curing protein, Doc toxin [Vibrio cholerae]QAV06783.1 Death on curing protein, Doc toxin [Vibrio cholerae]